MKLMLVALLGATAVLAEAQAPNFDRNFQRLDHIRSIQGRIPGPQNVKKQPLDYWKVGPNGVFPSAVASYGASLYFVDEPLGMSGEHLHTLSSTTTYSHNSPTGSAATNQGQSTLEYQVSGDLNNAITIGAIDSFTDSTDFSTAGNASATQLLDPGYHWSLTPTLTYAHQKTAGQVQDSWTPDFMVAWFPAKSPFGSSLDYTVSTPGSSEALQLAGMYTFGFKPEDPYNDARTSLRFAVQLTAGGQTSFSVGLAIALGGNRSKPPQAVATVL